MHKGSEYPPDRLASTHTGPHRGVAMVYLFTFLSSFYILAGFYHSDVISSTLTHMITYIGLLNIRVSVDPVRISNSASYDLFLVATANDYIMTWELVLATRMKNDAHVTIA